MRDLMTAALRVALVGAVLGACAAALTPAESADVAGTAAIIAKCEAEGLACRNSPNVPPPGGCYGVYQDCMNDAGLGEMDAP